MTKVITVKLTIERAVSPVLAAWLEEVGFRQRARSVISLLEFLAYSGVLCRNTAESIAALSRRMNGSAISASGDNGESPGITIFPVSANAVESGGSSIVPTGDMPPASIEPPQFNPELVEVWGSDALEALAAGSTTVRH